MSIRTWPGWQSFHCHYHGDRDLVVREWLVPVLRVLWQRDEITNAFFIRYSLGGPHLRLRLRPRPGREDAIRAIVHDQARAFFDAHPSTASRSEDEIRATNREILTNDDDAEDVIYEDATLVEQPYRAEVTRYGGAARLPGSLDLFALSSVAAITFVIDHADAPPGRRLPAALRLLAIQLAGLAEATDELLALGCYAADWSPAFQPLLARGDQAYERQAAVFDRLFRAALTVDGAADGQLDVTTAPPRMLAAGARALAQTLRDAPDAVRHEIKIGQLHMTANRLGLTNADEVYVGRMLTRAIEATLAADDGALQALEPRHRDQEARPALDELVRLAFDGRFGARPPHHAV